MKYLEKFKRRIRIEKQIDINGKEDQMEFMFEQRMVENSNVYVELSNGRDFSRELGFVFLEPFS